MTFFTVSELPGSEAGPGIVRRAVYLEHAMVTFSDFAPGSVVPEHRHPHEQITFVVRGALEFRLGEETRLLRAGDGVCCPPDVPHSAVTVEAPAFALDVWYPQREDYK